MFCKHSIAVSRTFCEEITHFSRDRLLDLCRHSDSWLNRATMITQTICAIPYDDETTLIAYILPNLLVIVDQCKTNDLPNPHLNLTYDNSLTHPVMLASVLGCDLFWNYSDDLLFETGIPCDPIVVKCLRNIFQETDLEQFIDTHHIDDKTARLLIKMSQSSSRGGSTNIPELLYELPLETWRVTLNPDQISYTTQHYDGPFLLTGGAGTGKTLIAIHRAAFLAAKLKPSEKLLLTTFGLTLVDELKYHLKHISINQNFPELLDRIEIINIDQWTECFLRDHGYPDVKINYSHNALLAVWDECIHACHNVPEKFNAAFFLHDWRRVIIKENCFSFDDYTRADQEESCMMPDQDLKSFLWPVFEKYISKMSESHSFDIYYAMHLCEEILDSLPCRPYQHVIADECQDFTTSAMRLLRKMTPHKQNDIFLCGDQSQRIFSTRVKLKACGIDTENRENALTVNYRTPYQTHQFALRFVKDYQLPNDINNSYCVPRGYTPERQAFPSFDDECAFIVRKIKQLIASDVPLHHICLVHRKNAPLNEYIRVLKENKIPCFKLDADNTYNDPDIPGIRIMTMHRVKGLEFDYIFITGSSENNLNCAFAHQTFPDDYKDAEQTEKCLLYVATTRARIKTWFTSDNGAFSHLIPLD